MLYGMHASHVRKHGHTRSFTAYLRTEYMLQGGCCTVSNWLNDRLLTVEPVLLSVITKTYYLTFV